MGCLRHLTIWLCCLMLSVADKSNVLNFTVVIESDNLKIVTVIGLYSLYRMVAEQDMTLNKICAEISDDV
ncbi:hypothetical protein CBW65_03030 [Tumebacillus avium]|uniref:Uncharacterized protein n=1 Tax=Tumebacillus avium TaxID=1903704 RepID=A0A1Y0IL92_9BACL|nr:hypothetical protein CBW65_03030 [Tumebacillus avium]